MRSIFKAIAEKTGKTPQPGFVRLEQLADNAKGTYIFPIKKSTGNLLATENRLDENDAFYATHARVRLKLEAPTKPGSGVYQTYPNQTAIPVVANEVVADDLESIFNSYLNVKVNNVDVLKAVDMQNSRVVSMTQQSAATNRSEQNTYDGLVDLHSVIRLGGSSTIDIALITPSYSGKLVQNTTATTRIYVALDFYGFLVTGGSALGEVSINY
jgi:hypothetical protein